MTLFDVCEKLCERDWRSDPYAEDYAPSVGALVWLWDFALQVGSSGVEMPEVVDFYSGPYNHIGAEFDMCDGVDAYLIVRADPYVDGGAPYLFVADDRDKTRDEKYCSSYDMTPSAVVSFIESALVEVDR